MLYNTTIRYSWIFFFVLSYNLYSLMKQSMYISYNTLCINALLHYIYINIIHIYHIYIYIYTYIYIYIYLYIYIYMYIYIWFLINLQSYVSYHSVSTNNSFKSHLNTKCFSMFLTLKQLGKARWFSVSICCKGDVNVYRWYEFSLDRKLKRTFFINNI